jgi:hypothetical protein
MTKEDNKTKLIDNKSTQSGKYGGNYNHVPKKHCTHFLYRSYYYPNYRNPYYESVYSNLKKTVYSPNKYHTE